MPIRGVGQFLESALASLASQTLPITELLVVDDGMTAEPRRTLERFALPYRVLEGPGRGPAAARNVAIDNAEGDLIAFLDDDDVWPVDKLTRQVGWLTAHAEDSAVGGWIVWFTEWDHARAEPAPTAELQSVLHVNLGAYVFHRRLFDEIGSLDDTLTFSEDVDLVLRMIDAGVSFSLIDRPMLYYRRHAASMTAGRTQTERRDFSRVLFRSLRRRPRQPGNPMAGLNDRLVREDI